LVECSIGSILISLGGTVGSNGVVISSGLLDNGPMPLGPMIPTSIVSDVHDSILLKIAIVAEVLYLCPKINIKISSEN
jgi:hypothetical protein